MGINLQDLPTDPDQLASDSEIFFEDSERSALAIVILAQLDPTETTDTKVPDSEIVRKEPRWNADQMKVITDAREMYGTWAE
jgi:hypothetical protein